MPVHVDIRINTHLIKRVHVARMTKNGMQPGSVNEYAVVVKPAPPTTGYMAKYADEGPTWLEWEEGVRFTHTYGDGVLTLLQKALAALPQEVLTER